MNGYSIDYYVTFECADGNSDGDFFTNEENARDYLHDCMESAMDDENPIVWYKITKTETSGGMIVTEDDIEEWSEK